MRHASQKTNITKVALKVRLAVIALLAILLFPHLLLQQVAADSNSDHSLRFMTYNVRNSQQGDQGLRDWQLRRDHLVRKILANRPDILALQEVSPQQRLELDGELESEYRGFGTGREGADQGEQCTIYLKKSLPVSQSGTFWLSPTPSLPSRGWDAQFPRVCTYAVVGNWLICNLHLDHLGHQSQLEGLRQIRRFTRDFPNCSVVVLGDLNVAPDSPTLLLMRDYSDIYAQLHPTMARSTTYHGFGQEPTYPRVDYVFTSPDVRGLRSEVLFEPGPSYSSDHFPLTATLERRR